MNEAGRQKSTKLSEILVKSETDLLGEWIQAQSGNLNSRTVSLIGESALREQSREFLASLRDALGKGAGSDITGPEWSPVREFLSDISQSRAKRGFTPAETALFVFSLKQPL